MTEHTEQKSNSSRTLRGKVVSDKMNKTIVVQVERKVQHPLYGKYVRRFSKMYAHDENNTCRMGDMVLIKESRPLSKTKRWMLVEILKREE
ncbi:MAG: 30S ribosomal protein S17 [Gammaproteobacteria bacterium RIFCSPHIGHO2_12_FULL_37_34]|nr:MAG: 30S ribosomal protein S17 [Gammaproteobacteria bacterium RIFCSPHIGHO2_12_FULL_37_34]